MINTFMSCENMRYIKLEKKINLNSNNLKEIRLDTINSFEWNELIIATPYTDLNKYQRYNSKYFSNSIKYYDNIIFIGFYNYKKGVKFLELKRTYNFDLILKAGIYKKTDSKLQAM